MAVGESVTERVPVVAWFALVKGEKLWGCRRLDVGCKDDLT